MCCFGVIQRFQLQSPILHETIRVATDSPIKSYISSPSLALRVAFLVKYEIRFAINFFELDDR